MHLITFAFYCILFGIVLPSGDAVVKLEIIMLLPAAFHVFIVLLTLKKPFSTLRHDFAAVYISILLFLIPSYLLITSGKLSLYLLLLAVFACIYLFGNIFYSRIVLLMTSSLFNIILLFISLSISFQAFNSVSLDNSDTLTTTSGILIARASIGSYESNSLAIACSGFVSLVIFSIFLRSKRLIISSKLNVSIAFVSIFSLYLTVLRTFSRTAIVALILSLLSVFIPKLISKVLNSFDFYKFKKKNLIFFLCLVGLISLLLLFFSTFQNDLFNLSLSRFSMDSLSNDVRTEIWSNNILLNYQNLFLGTGEFFVTDNFFISQVYSHGFLLGILLIFLSMVPFGALLLNVYSNLNTTPSLLIFASYNIVFSSFLYAFTSDFIGQSKTLPILYLTAALLNRFFSTRTFS